MSALKVAAVDIARRRAMPIHGATQHMAATLKNGKVAAQTQTAVQVGAVLIHATPIEISQDFSAARHCLNHRN